MQEMMRRRRRGGFVGRLAEVDSFRSNLRLPLDDEQRRFLFTVYGDAGVGKTSLVRHLLGIAKEQGALCAVVDHPISDVLSAMDAVAAQFANSACPISAFTERAQTYKRRRRELEADPEAPSGSGLVLARLALRVGLRAAGDVPVIGAVAEEVNADSVLDQTQRLRAFIGSKVRGHDEVQLMLAPVDALTSVFVADLQRLAGQHSLALFFDTYERTSPVLDSWLRELVDGRHGDLPANLTITVAGQYSLDANAWAEYLGEMVQMPLNPFSEAEAQELLAAYQVTDQRVAEIILALSGRLPLLLAMLAKGRPADPAQVGDRSGDAVERFLRWVEDERHRQVALLAALPRQVNEDVLAVLVGGADASKLFGWLRGQPFLTEAGGVCRYHDAVRAPMLRLQRGQAPQRWKEHHRALADAYARWSDELGLAEDRSWSDERWRDLRVEEIYHRLCGEALAVLPQALSSIVFALDAQRSLSRSWAEMVQRAGRDAAAPHVEDVGERLLGSIDASGSLIRFLTVLLDEAGLDTAARVIALGRRATEYENAGRVDLALADYDRAIELRPDDGRTIAWRGDAYRMLGRYEEALADFARAIDLDPDSGWAIGSRGQTYQSMGHYEQALADLTKAIELEPEYGWAIVSRGETFRQMERYEEALADFTRAIELDPQYGWAIVSRGETFRQMERYEEALADFTRAIELNPQYGWAIVSRGETYRQMERYEEALADFTRAIKLTPQYGWAIVSRGETYRQMERYEEALADFTRAIELDPQYGWAIVSRGETYRQMERFEEALADFTRAIELDPQYGWAIASRGETYRQMERYEEALADFTRAIELDPQYRWAIVSRGETYRQMERYEEALADFTRAIDLDPDDDWGIAQRGETHRQIERYEAALADFTRAMDLDPDDDWVIAGRGETYRQMERYEEALADFTRAIELDPQYRWAIVSRGETYRQMERYEEALADFTRAIELDPDDDWSHFCRGLVLLRLRHAEEAEGELRSAITISQSTLQRRPRDFRVVFNSALYHMAVGNPDAARRLYEAGMRDGATAKRVKTALEDLRLLASVTGDTPQSARLTALLQTPATG